MWWLGVADRDHHDDYDDDHDKHDDHQAPKATTHVWGLGVARHRVLIDCNGEHRDRAQDRGVWVVRTKYGKQLAAGAKILNVFVTTREEQQHYQQQ